MLDKVKELHGDGWTVELRWGYYCGEPHFAVDVMRGFERYKVVSLRSLEEAFEKVYRQIREDL